MKKIIIIIGILLSISSFGLEIVVDKSNNGSLKELPNNVVFANNLYWQDIKSNSLNWNDAKEYCHNLKLGELNNWYLPSREDFKTIFNRTTCKFTKKLII